MTLMTRVVELRAMQYRRTFRASIFSSFLNPVLFLLAMGVGLGTYVDRSGTANAARRDDDAGRRIRVDVPDHGRPELAEDVPFDVRDARLAARHRHRQLRLDR